MCSLSFCGKFNSEQLLFEAFFDVTRIVCRVKLFLKYSFSYGVTFDLFTFTFLSLLAVYEYIWLKVIPYIGALEHCA